MRIPPEHDRAMLRTDSAALRDCAARLDALTVEDLPAQCGPDWHGVLTALAGRCRVAADELDRAGAAFFTDPAASDDAEYIDAESIEGVAQAGAAQARAQARAMALALAGRLLGAPRAAAEPLASLAPLAPIAPLIRRLPGGR